MSEPDKQVPHVGFSTLLAASKHGEGWAFDHLFHHWNRPLTGFAGARGVVDVEEVVSEIFLGAFTSIRRFEGDERQFRAWLFRIARNKIADSHRQAGRRPLTIAIDQSTDPRFDLVGGDVEDDAEADFGRQRVESLLNELTEDQREVLLLRIVADLTVSEIATIVGKRPGAVKQLQRRALRRLEQLLNQQPERFSGDTRTPDDDDER